MKHKFSRPLVLSDILLAWKKNFIRHYYNAAGIDGCSYDCIQGIPRLHKFFDKVFDSLKLKNKKDLKQNGYSYGEGEIDPNDP